MKHRSDCRAHSMCLCRPLVLACTHTCPWLLPVSQTASCRSNVPSPPCKHAATTLQNQPPKLLTHPPELGVHVAHHVVGQVVAHVQVLHLAVLGQLQEDVLVKVLEKEGGGSKGWEVGRVVGGCGKISSRLGLRSMDACCNSSMNAWAWSRQAAKPPGHCWLLAKQPTSPAHLKKLLHTLGVHGHGQAVGAQRRVQHRVLVPAAVTGVAAGAAGRVRDSDSN